MSEENNTDKTASRKKSSSSSKKMAENEELENMVLSFRVSELQMLLGFAGRNKSGRKNELQARALELLRLRSHPVQLKIRELYKTIQADQLAGQMYGQSGNSGEPPIDQTMHSRNNYYTRQLGQQQAQSSVPPEKVQLIPAHQASLPQVPRSNPVYPPPAYSNVGQQLPNDVEDWPNIDVREVRVKANVLPRRSLPLSQGQNKPQYLESPIQPMIQNLESARMTSQPRMENVYTIRSLEGPQYSYVGTLDNLGNYPTTSYTSVIPRASGPYASYPYAPKGLPAPLPIPPANQYPVHPDVRLKKLPFFDLLGELLKPSSLMPQGSLRMQENTFTFHLTPKQSTDIASSRDCRAGGKMDYTVQVQMRFCLQETSCEQEDYFPPSIQVKVNGKMCPLPNPIPTNKPGVEPKRPPRPVNVSAFVKLSPTVANQIHVTWSADYGRRYAVAIYLVKKLTSAELLNRLKTRGPRHSDYTRGLIKEKLNEDADSEIATTSLRVSLACPLGKMRMSTPCRASTCSHLQCFDASLFLQMNERKPTWSCPVCDKSALYDNLVIDGYFQDVLNSNKLLPDVNEVQLLQDGSWENLLLKKEKDKNENKTPIDTKPDKKVDVDTVDLDETNPTTPTPKEKKRAVVIDLISDSDDDDEEDSTVSHRDKKLATNVTSPKKSQSNSTNNSTSDSPELMIIDLE